MARANTVTLPPLRIPLNYWTVVVVAQLVEQLLPTLKVRSSYPDIGKILSTNYTIKNTKDEKKEKEAGNL